MILLTYADASPEFNENFYSYHPTSSNNFKSKLKKI